MKDGGISKFKLDAYFLQISGGISAFIFFFLILFKDSIHFFQTFNSYCCANFPIFLPFLYSLFVAVWLLRCWVVIFAFLSFTRLGIIEIMRIILKVLEFFKLVVLLIVENFICSILWERLLVLFGWFSWMANRMILIAW